MMTSMPGSAVVHGHRCHGQQQRRDSDVRLDLGETILVRTGTRHPALRRPNRSSSRRSSPIGQRGTRGDEVAQNQSPTTSSAGAVAHAEDRGVRDGQAAPPIGDRHRGLRQGRRAGCSLRRIACDKPRRPLLGWANANDPFKGGSCRTAPRPSTN